jgi:hypothetical protein
MKYLPILLLLMIAPLFDSYAQFFRFGAKAGGGFSTVQGDDAPSEFTNHLAGFHGGFIGTYEFVSKLSVQAELLYDQKGFTYAQFPINPDQVLVDNLRLHYVIVPLQLKLQKGGLFVLAGPYLSYLISENSDVRIVDRATAQDPEPVTIGKYPTSSSDFETWDYGYTAGLGIELDNGFFMSFHNTGGFRSFSKQFDQRNFAFKLSVGMLINP